MPQDATNASIVAEHLRSYYIMLLHSVAFKIESVMMAQIIPLTTENIIPSNSPKSILNKSFSATLLPVTLTKQPYCMFLCCQHFLKITPPPPLPHSPPPFTHLSAPVNHRTQQFFSATQAVKFKPWNKWFWSATLTILQTMGPSKKRGVNIGERSHDSE